MSIPTNPTNDMPTLLNHLGQNIEDTIQHVSSAAEGIKKMIHPLRDQFSSPTVKEYWDEQLLHRFSESKLFSDKIEPSDIMSVHEDLEKIKKLLPDVADKNNPVGFPALSEKEQDIIKTADSHRIVKCLRVSYDFFHRFYGYDPRICLFLAIFPENAVIRKRFLIYWWIGEGLVRDEKEGKKIFEDLLDLELLIPHRKDRCPRVNKCQVHPWIRYLLISEAKRQNILHLDDGIPRFDFNNCRRTCMINGQRNLTNESGSEIETLTTIFNVNERDLDLQEAWLAKLKRLKVLQLGRWQVSPTHHIEVLGEQFLKGLATQKRLKFLSLRGISGITSLPRSIFELPSLEILDLKACHNLETLPGNIASLKKLTHLDVSECHLLESMPKGLDKLASLQVLKGFLIGNPQKTPIRIEHLRKLAKLERLSIHIGSEAVIQDKEFDKLQDLEKVRRLKISWGVVTNKDRVLKESLSLPPRLEKLDLEGIPHDAVPEWLNPDKLTTVEKLYIRGGNLCKLEFTETKRWNVKILLVKYTKMPKIDETSLLEMFPSLEYVKFQEKKGRQ